MVPNVQGLWLSSGSVGTVWDADEVVGNAIVAPLMKVSRNGNQVNLSWSVFPEGYVLQQNSSPTAASWTDVPGGGDGPVTLPIGAAPQFFRLKK